MRMPEFRLSFMTMSRLEKLLLVISAVIYKPHPKNGNPNELSHEFDNSVKTACEAIEFLLIDERCLNILSEG